MRLVCFAVILGYEYTREQWFMEPNTTTEPATQEPGVEPTTQPEEQPGAAVTTPEPEPTPTTEPEEPTEEGPAPADNPAPDEDLTAWAANKGIDLNTPEGQAKALKSMREAEKKLHDSTAQASSLRKQIEQSPATNDDQRVQRLETLYAVSQWKADKQLTPDQDAKMGEYLSADPIKTEMVKQGLLSLDEVYVLSGASQVNPAAIKQQGGQEALEKLANKQRATAPTGSAMTHDVPKEDPIAAELARD
jgi:hypothetical protein